MKLFRFVRTSMAISVLAVFLSSPASGLVNIGNPLGNTSAPTGAGGQPTDPGFANVGSVRGSTGVYLGNGWVLTADHVGVGTFTVGGNSYNYNGVDSHQIGGADLRLFRLSTFPALSGVKIAVSTPVIGSETVMIGAGRTPQAATATTWYVDTDVDPWLWDTSAFPEADSEFAGYTSNSSKAVRWGTNIISGISSQAYGSYSTMDLLYTTFSEDPIFQTAYEAQGIRNDSGGAMFVETATGWELAGTIVTVQNWDNQPGGNTSAIFGNRTLAVDLADYAAEINSIIPEPRAFALFAGIISATVALRRRRTRMGVALV